MRFEEVEEVEAQLKELDYLVKKCRIHYEQFFMGNEKREPVDLRRQIQKFLRNSALEKHRRASVKFRFMTLTQKFVTLSNYWDRILRTMEEGTFNTLSFRGFRPRVAEAGDGRVASPEREEHRVVHIDPEEMERESIAKLAETWGEQKIVDDRDTGPAQPDLSPDSIEQIFPPDAGERARRSAEPPAPPRPRPTPQPQAPVEASPEVRPSQRPTVQLDAPQIARPTTPPPLPPQASMPSPAAAAAPRPRPPSPASAAAEPVEGIPGARRLYERYRHAKVDAIADSEDLSYDQFEARLVKKREMLKQKFQQEFEFDVVSRDGKVSIVAKKR